MKTLFRWSAHCLERMQRKETFQEQMLKMFLEGEIIEDYPEDSPHPSCLILDIL